MESERLVKKLVEDLKNSVGEEFARKRAKKAGVSLDKRLRVLDIKDRTKALEDLRLPDFYCDVLTDIIDNVGKFYGYEHALMQARHAPLVINSEGEVQGFYGTGRKATDILITQMEREFGADVIEMRLGIELQEKVEEDRYELLPERIREKEDDKGFFTMLLG